MSNAQLEKQELLEITRTLLSQRSFTDLLLQLRQILQRLQLADQVTLVLFDPDSERVSFYGLDAHRRPVNYQDETLLANGPVSRLRQSPL
ncbi:hypothetical protein, partial [Bacillus sp. mrc49]